MSPRTPKSRKAKKKDEYYTDPASEYDEDDETGLAESHGDDFVLAFAGLSVKAITEGRRFTWSKQTRARFVQRALVGNTPFTAHSLPTPLQLLELAHDLELPLNRGKEVAKICVAKLVDCIQYVMSPKCLPGLIEERKRGDEWSISVSKALFKAASSDSFSWRAITSGEIAEDHADRGRTFRELKNVNEVGKTELIKRTMDLLVRGAVITKDTRKSPHTPLNIDLSWLKSPSPSPARTSSMPPPALSNYASDTDSDTELEPFPPKAKKQHSSGTPSRSSSKHNKSFPDDDGEVLGRKSTPFNKYLTDDSDTEDVVPASKRKTKTVKTHQHLWAQSESEDEVLATKHKTPKSLKEQLKSAAKLSTSDDDNPAPEVESKSKSTAKEQLDSLLSMLSKQVDSPKKKLPKQVDNSPKKKLPKQVDDSPKKLPKQVDDSPTKLSTSTNPTETTPDMLRSQVMIAILEKGIPDHLHSLVQTLRTCGMTPAEIATILMSKMSNEQTVAPSDMASSNDDLLDL
ncbi:hypothetical protein AC579_10256 [Pseudocercospora musae]|uniref:Uncharacterized protein n=1 Tax=Pseudocercospora musae TaxID=113226 RepID=A0A139HZD5_9PEZI|nr:hypothetical protein AC579_10256 [Pseudocercospora musae]KXT07798.1 hypothetical protein AC579_10256 [Pseudocercospora musae]